MIRIGAFWVLFWLLTGAANAQTVWVQVEAQPTLTEAEARARAYARDFPNVNGYQLRSGWYAIAFGPYPRADAVSQLNALLAERLIPGDSFVADGSNFTRQFWPVGGAVLLPQPQPELVPEPVPVPDVEAALQPPDPVPEVAEPAAPVIAEETPAEARRAEAALTGDERKLLQTALQWEGFYSSAIDGAIGPGTRASMQLWQESKGYEATGVLSTRQRGELVAAYQAVLTGLGIAPVRDNSAGIEVQMPTALVVKGNYEAPFAHYNSRDGSGVRVILISQAGDEATLGGLFDILQTLEILPLDGPRERSGKRFFIDGANAETVSHAEAQLTADGAVKGFILIWPTGDEKRRDMTLKAMQASFTALPGAVLPDSAGAAADQDLDLLAGLEIRRPDVSQSGFYIDTVGHVLTAAAGVASCARITIDDEIEATVAAADPALGVAVLQARVALAPMGYARFQPGVPRLQSEIALAGYSYDGRLGAPVLTFGRLADTRGLDGETDLTRLVLTTTPGDTGGPVFDASGAVVGLLLPPPAGSGQVLPDDASFARDAAALAEFLSNSGLTATAAEPEGDIAPEDLTRLARDMTVQVSCWN